ncbi:hypothetical protein [Kushneria phyllosphaerae]|uniref:Uncharacterized protein n=1 Tax=Kushneria phyllosphaerae TaxID=2100822 RepID=A0A2R8CJD2_9GAMM|nr:hypothetical protein [Kushneria phyllosphaerae]SPJ32854.1 hypothetical protein KSP9073_00856 [Kushneria phyllosphaerae]
MNEEWKGHKEYRIFLSICLMASAFLLLIGLAGYYFIKEVVAVSILLVISVIPFVLITCAILVSPNKTRSIGVKSVFFGFAILIVMLIVFSLFFYDALPIENKDKLNNLHIFMTVGSAGMLGGLMKAFLEESIVNEDGPDMWKVARSVLIAFFVSIVLFFLLRAGIINQTRVDTFNVWGVAGVSSVTGFFSEKIIERFKKLFHEVLGERVDDKE